MPSRPAVRELVGSLAQQQTRGDVQPAHPFSDEDNSTVSSRPINIAYAHHNTRTHARKRTHTSTRIELFLKNALSVPKGKINEESHGKLKVSKIAYLGCSLTGARTCSK